MKTFGSFQGMITAINDFITGGNELSGWTKIVSVDNGNGNLVNFIVTPDTYFVDNAMVSVGDRVTGFYDADAPTILIYPPQYQAIVMVRYNPYQNVKVAYFNSQLISSDNTLKLNLAPWTQLLLENGQAFTQNPANRDLIVIYGATTMSIPAQTTPYKIVVIC